MPPSAPTAVQAAVLSTRKLAAVPALVMVGLPLAIDDRLYNVAVLRQGRVSWVGAKVLPAKRWGVLRASLVLPWLDADRRSCGHRERTGASGN